MRDRKPGRQITIPLRIAWRNRRRRQRTSLRAPTCAVGRVGDRIAADSGNFNSAVITVVPGKSVTQSIAPNTIVLLQRQQVSNVKIVHVR